MRKPWFLNSRSVISPKIWPCIHPFFPKYAPVSTPSSYCSHFDYRAIVLPKMHIVHCCSQEGRCGWPWWKSSHCWPPCWRCWRSWWRRRCRRRPLRTTPLLRPPPYISAHTLPWLITERIKVWKNKQEQQGTIEILVTYFTIILKRYPLPSCLIWIFNWFEVIRTLFPWPTTKCVHGQRFDEINQPN